jgi:hypothetical protein
MGTAPQGKPPDQPPPDQQETPPPFEPDYEILTVLERGESSRQERAFQRAVRVRQERGLT